MVVGLAGAEGIRQLSQGGPHVDKAKSRHGAPCVVTRQEPPECARGLYEIVAIPELRPRHEDEQEARFEEQGDQQ